MDDSYFVPETVSEGIYKEKGSRFLSFVFPVESTESAESIVREQKKKFFDSKHVCFAWRIGPDGKIQRAYDAGEPSHTAGDPILNQIRSSNLTNILVVVVRYFGGTLLGTSGLIKAYEEAAENAISNNKMVQKFLHKKFRIQYSFSQTQLINKIFHKFKPEVIESSFLEKCDQTLGLRLSLADFFEDEIRKNGIFIEELE